MDMKSLIAWVGKRFASALVTAVFFVMAVVGITYAVTYPTSTPSGETPGGKFRTELDKIWGALTIDTSKNVGIGTATPTAKLEVAGQVKITGGTPGEGKVLTSDTGGLASWKIATNGVPAVSQSGKVLTVDVGGNPVWMNPAVVDTPIPSGYTEVAFNMGEDVYGDWINGTATDTCDGNASTRYRDCLPDEQKTCIDYQYVPSGFDMNNGGWDYGSSAYRTVSCKKATLLRKMTSSGIQHTYGAAELAGRYPWYPINAAKANAEAICRGYAQSYVSYTYAGPNGTYCGGIFNYYNTRGGDLQVDAMGCG